MLEKIGLDLVRRYRKQTINLQENIYLFFFLYWYLLFYIIFLFVFLCIYLFIILLIQKLAVSPSITSQKQLDIIKKKRYPYVWQGEPFVARVIQTRFLDNHPDSMCRRKPFGVDYTSTSIVDQNIFNTKLSFDFDADSMSWW